MKKLLFPFIAGVLISSSCSTYYVSTLNSKDTVRDTKSGSFITENDSVMVTYNFYGKNAPISVTVFNKLDKPLYIDWQRSALIIDKNATSFMGDDINIKGESSYSGSSSDWGLNDHWYINSGTGTFSAKATLPRNISFVPPQSMVEKTKLRLANIFYDKIENLQYHKTKLAKLNGEVQNVKQADFTQEDSPLSFKSYLTLYFPDEKDNRTAAITFQQNFYVSQVMKLKHSNPSDLLSLSNKMGDTFYIQEEKGKGTAVLAGAVAVGFAGAALERSIVKAR